MEIFSRPALTNMAHMRDSLLLVALLIPTTVCAADFTGRVVGVIDGDTLEVLHNNRPERIRLSGIDCPEKGQAFGERGRQRQIWFMGRKSPSRPTATTSTSAPSGM